MRDVVHRGKPPCFAIWEEEAEVPRVVITNGRRHIERHATEDFGSRLWAKPELINQEEQLRAKLWELVPVRELQKRKWLPDTGDLDVLETSVRDFLGVETLDDEPHLAVAARRTNVN